MHYVMDIHGNYVKKSESRVRDEPEQPEAWEPISIEEAPAKPEALA